MGCSFATEKVRQGALACARPRPHVTRETTEKAEGAMRWWVTLNRRRYEVPRSGLVLDALCGLPPYVALDS